MIYEIVDEMIDFGYVQSTVNESLTDFVDSRLLKTSQTMTDYLVNQVEKEIQRMGIKNEASKSTDIKSI